MLPRDEMMGHISAAARWGLLNTFARLPLLAGFSGTPETV